MLLLSFSKSALAIIKNRGLCLNCCTRLMFVCISVLEYKYIILAGYFGAPPDSPGMNIWSSSTVHIWRMPKLVGVFLLAAFLSEIDRSSLLIVDVRKKICFKLVPAFKYLYLATWRAGDHVQICVYWILICNYGLGYFLKYWFVAWVFPWNIDLWPSYSRFYYVYNCSNTDSSYLYTELFPTC